MLGAVSVPWFTGTGRECTTSPWTDGRKTLVPLSSSSAVLVPRSQLIRSSRSVPPLFSSAWVMAVLAVSKFVRLVQLANTGEQVFIVRLAGVRGVEVEFVPARSTYACA